MSSLTLRAQDVTLFDWETTETSPSVNFSFGNGHFADSTFAVVDNPDNTGMNTTAKVYQWCKANDGNTWGGINFVTTDTIDMTGTAYTLCLDVWMPHDGNVLLKLENSIDDDEVDVSLVEPYTGNGAWQQVCFDYAHDDADGDLAAGRRFASFTVFMDFGNTPTDDECHYFDNLIQREGGPLPKMGDVIFDWQAEDTSLVADFSFGNGHLGDSVFAIVNNPLKLGQNRSSKVYQWCKANDGNTWGGINYDKSTNIDFTGTALTLCMDVLMPHNGNVLLKMENSLDDDEVDVSLVEPYTGDGAWQQVCFDYTTPDNDGDVAAGRIFPSFTIFMDFGNTPAEDECHYYDNLIQVEGPELPLSGDVLVDWEADGISVAGAGAFGNGHFADSTFAVVANPNPSGHNKSDSVYVWCKANNGNTWGGIYFDIDPPIALLDGKTSLCLDVMMPNDGEVLLKIEKSSDGGGDASLISNYTGNGKWQQVCFDYTVADASGDVGAGFTYTRFTVFPNWGVTPTEDECYYFDNLTQAAPRSALEGDLISDWESDSTSVDPFVFGGATIAVSNNPHPDELNSSDSTFLFCKDNASMSWAGFAFDVDTIDVTGDLAMVCLSVYSDVAGTIRLKLEGATDGSETVSMDREYDTAGAWQKLCYDFTKPGVDDKEALGHLYTKLTVFPGFGNIPTDPTCYNIDNIYKNTNGTGVLVEFIGKVLAKSPEHSTFMGYVNQLDLSSLINGPGGDPNWYPVGVTVFAPSNAAFDALTTEERDALDNNTDNALYNMVLHHIAYGALTADVLTDGYSFITQNGMDATVSGNSVNGATITEADVLNSNGTLHYVDKVFTFPDEPDFNIYHNWETPEFSKEWFRFGVANNRPNMWIEDNPDPSGINTSAKVAHVKRYPDGVWWQGNACRIDRPLNFIGNLREVCLDVYFPAPGTFAWKIEKHATGEATDENTPRYEMDVPVANQWVRVCQDVTEASDKDPFIPAAGRIFNSITLFFDVHNTSLPADTTSYYWDNFVVRNLTVGTNEIEKLDNFSFYPNPSANWITMESDTPIHHALIFDITGKQLMNILDPVAKQIDVSQLAPGMYFTTLHGNKGEPLGTVKFVKQ